LVLTIERKMVGIFTDQHMCQKTGSRSTAFDMT
jgi:hypothetical protein